MPLVSHHPLPEHLVDYAAGTSGEGLSLLIATHLALCPQCRRQVRGLEAVGGVGLEADETAAEVGAPRDLPPPLVARPRARDGAVLPEPLLSYAGRDADRLAWRLPFVGPKEVPLTGLACGSDVKLLMIPAGAAMPAHTHGGLETTLVLTGGFSDQTGHYARGDVATADPSITHKPRADAGGPCICLAVVEAPLRLTGPLGRIVSFMLR